MCISDWSSDVCSSDLGDAKAALRVGQHQQRGGTPGQFGKLLGGAAMKAPARFRPRLGQRRGEAHPFGAIIIAMLEEMFGDGHRQPCPRARRQKEQPKSEEHTSELQSLMRISYAVFCLKKKKKKN